MILRFSILLLGILFLISCEKMWEGEIIVSDYESELNVYGFIAFEDQMGNAMNPKNSVVYVHRTLAINENPYEDSNYLVNGAEVNITSSGESTEFIEGGNSSNPYYGAPDGFDPQFDAEYALEINAQNGMSLIGTLYTPPEPQLLMYPDSIHSNLLFTLKWNPSADAIVQVKIEPYKGCHFYDKSKNFENGETEWTTKIFDCYDTEYNDYPDSLYIQLTFMDINYYDYFVNSEEDEFLNFLMGISGTTRHAFGVEGGLGVFGSYATETVILPFGP